MTRKLKSVRTLFLVSLPIFPSQVLFSQQSSLQTSFLAPAAVHFGSTGISANGILASIAEAEHLPYLNALAKETKPGVQVFLPTTSDLLIQQAEDRFRNGKKFYQDRDFSNARVEFDAAIDAMLKASIDPTDRRLFESRLEEMVDVIHSDDISGMGAAPVDDLQRFDKAPLDDIVAMTFSVNPKIKDKVQTEVKQTSSALPLVVNDTVLSYINYFNSRGRRTMEAGLERAGKYRAMISRILAEEGVPQELIHLAQAESGFLPRAVSRAAAEGMWQFVKFRGNEYGLKQTPLSDDRLDPEKATRAAAHHLHDLYKEFGDWYLAIAAYNCGPGTIQKAVERTGYADFWQLRARGVLPVETTNYVPIILAMTIMSKNAPEYGLDHINADSPLEYDTITTASQTNLALIADLTDTPLSQLLQLNPALLRSVAPADFEIRVPKGTAAQVTAALNLVPAERRASWRIHRVEAGETLSSIARLYDSNASEIAAANSLGAQEPGLGDRLVIPASYREEVSAPGTPRTRASRTSVRRHASAALTSLRNGSSKPQMPAASVRRQLHPASGTIAQLKVRSRSLSR